MRPSSNIDLSNLNTSRSLAVLSVAPGSRVLDIGAGDGSVARALLDRGCQVTGVEIDEARASEARAFCHDVITGDIEDGRIRAMLAGQTFDVVLMLDVLDQVRDPAGVLAFGRDHLAPGGRIVTSVPNITHGAVRLSLMRGEFRYAEAGLLDRSHLRFFDRPSVESLFPAAGLHIVERLRVTRGLQDTEVPVDLESTSPALIEAALAGDDATTYQFVFVAADGRTASTSELPSLSEHLQRRVHELEARCRDLELLTEHNRDTEDRQKALIDDLARRADRGASQIAELTTELTSRMQELEERHRDVRSLQSDIALREDFLTQYRVEREQLLADAARLQQERASLAEDARLSLERGLQASEAQARCAAAVEAHTQVAAAHAALLDQHAQVAAAHTALLDQHTQIAAAHAALLDQHAQVTAAHMALLDEHARCAAAQVALIDQHARLQEAHTALLAYTNSAGFRVVNAASIRLRRFPRVYGMLRSAVRRSARRAPGV